MSNILNYVAIVVAVLIGIISITNGTFSLFAISVIIGAILWFVNIKEEKKW
jgi:hypothetical protein